ncbi:MAG: Tetratricopeptide repeat protein [Parcubacteria group bacterium Licking1014_1]|nr:MAG: Tetratricopeptide repeat protein [Parcubacteria group bacterium Licking1014_1]
MEINKKEKPDSIFYKIYLAGFFLIMTLPVLVVPPYFYPVDWGKTIVFRSVLSVLLFLFIFQFLYKKNELKLPTVKKNKIIWLLIGLFIIFLLASVFSSDALFSFWGSPYRAGGFITFAFYFAFALLAFFILKKSDWNKIWNFSIFVGIMVSFMAIIQYYGLFNKIFLSVTNRPPSTLGNPILLGIYLLLLIFPTISFAIKKLFDSTQNKIKKIFYCFAILLFLYVILITGSRSAYLGFLVGITYFILFYPVRNLKISNGVKSNKIAILKIILAALLVTVSLTVYYVNSRTEYPQILQKNRIFQAMRPRLSIEMFLQDPRFSAWQVILKQIKEKPLLGWGPENMTIGFDKNYNPSLPYINKDWGGWWDRAHNILLDIAATTGIPALIIYLALLGTLFWQLQKVKKQLLSETNENPVIYHGIQATLIAYIVANFFSFDGFSSYLLFFLIIGYSLHLTTQTQNEKQNLAEQKKTWRKPVLIFVSVLALVIFLWQYNFLPFQINGQTQKAIFLAEDKKCDRAFALMDNVLPRHSFLDAYLRIKYIETIKICAEFYPEKSLEYANRGAELMLEATKIRPLYARLWIFLGSFTTIKASAEKDPALKTALMNEADSYFKKAKELAPNHQEILLESAKIDMVSGNYRAMKEKSEKCVTLDPTIKDCYWIKALSEIYLKDFENAKIDIRNAEKRGFQIASLSSLHQLANAYATVENYDELIIIYQELIKINPHIPQYHSSLAFTYAQTGEYKKARQEAMIFLKLMPEAKEEVNLFLKTLPY